MRVVIVIGIPKICLGVLLQPLIDLSGIQVGLVALEVSQYFLGDSIFLSIRHW